MSYQSCDVEDAMGTNDSLLGNVTTAAAPKRVGRATAVAIALAMGALGGAAVVTGARPAAAPAPAANLRVQEPAKYVHDAGKFAEALAKTVAQKRTAVAPVEKKDALCTSTWSPDTSKWCPEGGCGGGKSAHPDWGDDDDVWMGLGWGNYYCTTTDCCTNKGGEVADSGSGGCCVLCASNLDDVDCGNAEEAIQDGLDDVGAFANKCLGNDIVNPKKFLSTVNDMSLDDQKTIGFHGMANFEDKWTWCGSTCQKLKKKAKEAAEAATIAAKHAAAKAAKAAKIAAEKAAIEAAILAHKAALQAAILAEKLAQKLALAAIKVWAALPGLLIECKKAAKTFGSAAIPLLKDAGAAALSAGAEGYKLMKLHGPGALDDAKILGGLVATKLAQTAVLAKANVPGLIDDLDTFVELSVSNFQAAKDYADDKSPGVKQVFVDAGKDLADITTKFYDNYPFYVATAQDIATTACVIAAAINDFTVKYAPDVIDKIQEVALIIGEAASQAKYLVLKYGPTVISTIEDIVSKLGTGISFVADGISGLYGQCMGKDVDVKLLAQSFSKMSPKAKFALGMARTPTEDPVLEGV